MKWNSIVLAELALDRGGSVDPAKYPDEIFELYSIPAFDAGTPEVVLGSQIGSTKKAVEANDVMISKIVPHIRRACVVGERNGHRQIASGEWIIFRSEKVWPQYLRWVLVGDTFHAEFMRTVSGVGGSLLRARPSEVSKIEIPLPPLPEQKRIAGILDAADALRAKRREALAQLDSLLQATFLDLFGDPVTNPKRWERKPVEDVLHLERPISYGILKPGDYEKDGVVMLRIQDIRGGRVSDDELHRVPSSLSNQFKRTLLSGGEIVISLVGTIGLCALVPSRFAGSNVHRNLAVLAPSKLIDSAFLFQQLVSDHFQRQIRETMKGGIQSLLNLGDLKRLLVLVPPIDDQLRFRHFFESHERQKGAQGAHLAELDALFASLQSRAFRGEL